MPYTVKIIETPHKGHSPDQLATHQTAVKEYLDAQTVATLHVTTDVSGGFYVTTIVFT